MTTTTRSAPAFPSLAALRARHTELLRSLPAEGASDRERESILEFLETGAASGILIDAPADREAAQGLLDYWKATLYTQRPSSLSSAIPPRVPTAVLANVDRGRFEEIIQRVEAILPREAASEADTRRILLNLIHLEPEGSEFRLTTLPRADLDHLVASSSGPGLLAQLIDAGLLRVNDANTVELSYEALTRRWPRLARWLEKRRLFRDAAMVWDKHNRDPGALIVTSLLDEGRSYKDLNNLEKEFVAASEAEAARLVSEKEAIHQRDIEQVKRLTEESANVRYWQRIGVLVGVFSVAMVLLTVWALRQRNHANEAREGEKKASDLLLVEKERSFALERERIAAQEANRHKEAQAALEEKKRRQQEHVSKKILLVQTLGDVATASSDAEFDLASNRWKEVSEGLRKDTWWFQGFLANHDAEISAMLRSRRDAAERRSILLEISQAIRQVVEQMNDPGFLSVLRAPQARWYGDALYMADQITCAVNQDRPITEVAAYRRQFWKLYWGEMALVEDQSVAAAMKKFGDVLTVWEEAAEKGKGLLAPAEVKKAMPGLLTQLRDRVQGEFIKQSRY